MRLTSACLAIGVSLIASAGVPAQAGDLGNGAAGGIRDYGGGAVPVPMPSVYEENFKWYLRGDIGSAFKNTGTFGNNGWPITFSQPGDWHELSIVTLGFGKYVTPSLRAEFTVDYRPDRVIASGSQTILGITKTAQLANTTVSATVGGVAVTSNASVFVTNSYTGNLAENIAYENSTFMASGIYDFNRGGRLRPYVGAGVGIAMHQVSRNSTDIYTCAGSTKNTIPDNGSIVVPPASSPNCDTSSASGLKDSYATTANTTMIGYGLAAALQAGITYDITARTHLDTGYRMLWQSGHLNVASANGLSSLRVNDQINHEIRTGIRWDIW